MEPTTVPVREPIAAGTAENAPAAETNAPPAAGGLSVVVVRTAEALAEHVPALEHLGRVALEPNPFYEPFMLLPALQSFAAGRQLELLLFYRPDPAGPRRPPILCGFFPLERRRRFKGLPIQNLTLFKHIHCFLCSPLVRPDAAAETMAAFFDWLRQDSGAAFIKLRGLVGEGPVHQLLVEELYKREQATTAIEWYTRALYRPGPTVEAYLKSGISGRARKEVRRKEKRLTEMGQFAIRELPPAADPGPWLDEFLQLEASGWKGKNGSAIACSAAERSFFLDSAKAAHERGRLMLLGMFLDERALALKCNFLAGEGSFAFKIAFDESFANYSPGFVLEIENIRRLHERPEIRWMDSCADAQHWMINRLWPGRRTIQSLLVSTGRAPGDLIVAAVPALKWLRRKVFRRSSKERQVDENERGTEP